MKTLDEVIAELEDEGLFPDALQYLKELREMTDIPMEYFENGGTSQILGNTSQITCPKCHSELVILSDPDSDHAQLEKCRALLQDFYQNDPLTWKELKEMVGQPVWVEVPQWSEWLLISFIDNDRDEMYLRDKWGNGVSLNIRNNLTWQAYRKERQ